MLPASLGGWPWAADAGRGFRDGLRGQTRGGAVSERPDLRGDPLARGGGNTGAQQHRHEHGQNQDTLLIRYPFPVVALGLVMPCAPQAARPPACTRARCFAPDQPFSDRTSVSSRPFTSTVTPLTVEELQRGLGELREHARVVADAADDQCAAELDCRLALGVNGQALYRQRRAIQGIVQSRLAIVGIMEREQLLHGGPQWADGAGDLPFHADDGVIAADLFSRSPVVGQGYQVDPHPRNPREPRRAGGRLCRLRRGAG